MKNLMSCEEARDLMLEADLEELRGHGESAVAAHIRQCDECAEYALRIEQSYQQMNASLARLSSDRVETKVISIRRRRPLRWLPLPIAAAAAIALLMIPRQREVMPNVDLLGQLMMEEPPIIATRTGDQALVIEKNELTIVWLYQSETR